MRSDLPEDIFTEVIAAREEQRGKEESEQVAVISIYSYPCFGVQSVVWSTDLQVCGEERATVKCLLSFKHKVTNMS